MIMTVFAGRLPRNFWAVLSVVLLFLGCHKVDHSIPSTEIKTGWIQGRITIGPLRPGPVRIDEQEPEPPAELFASHKIVLLNPNGETKIKEAAIDAKGNYKVSISPGDYLVDVQPHDIGFGNFTPQSVTVESGKSVLHNIDIDTGMR